MTFVMHQIFLNFAVLFADDTNIFCSGKYIKVSGPFVETSCVFQCIKIS